MTYSYARASKLRNKIEKEGRNFDEYFFETDVSEETVNK